MSIFLIIFFLYIVLTISGISPLLSVLMFIAGVAYFIRLTKQKDGNNKVNKPRTVDRPVTNSPVRNATDLGPNSHISQLNYSTAYSAKKDESHYTIKDKPLSEAERNVLYGR